MICPKCRSSAVASPHEYGWRCESEKCGKFMLPERGFSEILVEIDFGRTCFLACRTLDGLFAGGLTRYEGEKWSTPKPKIG